MFRTTFSSLFCALHAFSQPSCKQKARADAALRNVAELRDSYAEQRRCGTFWLMVASITLLSPLEMTEAATWKFVGGNWSQNGDRLTQSDPYPVSYAYCLGQAFDDCTVEADFRVRPTGQGVKTAGLILRSTRSLEGYFVHFDTRGDQILLHRGDLLDGANEVGRKRGVGLENDKWHSVRASASGNRIDVYLDGKLLLSAEDDTHQMGLGGVYTSQGAVEFKDFKISGARTQLPQAWSLSEPNVARDIHSQKLATILDRKVLCKQPGRYIGWPSITQAPNKDLLAVFSGDRESHVDPAGKTQMVRSTDGGKTWSDPVTINDLAVDDRDAGIVCTRKGTLVVSWFTGPPYHTKLQGHYVIRSSDNGHTWSKPIRTQVTAPHGPIALADGRLLYLGLNPHCSHTKPDNFNGPPADSPHSVSVEQSRDDGRSWQLVANFPVPATAQMLSFDEPHLVETTDGTIVAQFRDCNAPNRLWQSESADGGRTWSTPWQTPLHGYPPHLLRLSNGWLLSTYAKRWPPFGQFACLSRDHGKSWDTEDEIQLSRAYDSDLGYPATVQLADDTFWTVYYEIDRPGEKPCLIGTHWKLQCLPEPAR